LIELGTQTDCKVYSEFGNWLQDLSIHTSCSKPVDLGDASVRCRCRDGHDRRGEIGIGQNVLYTYKITNNSDVPAVDVIVLDDQLGPVPGARSRISARTRRSCCTPTR